MDIFESLTVFLVIFLLFGIPLILTFRNVKCIFNAWRIDSSKVSDVLTLSLGTLYTWIILDYIGLGIDYDETLVINGVSPSTHSPISVEYMPSFCVVLIIALGSMLVLCLSKKRKPPLISAFLIGGIYIGNVLGILFCCQISINATDEFNFLLFLFPLNYLLMSIRLISEEIVKQLNHMKEDSRIPQGKIMKAVYKLLAKSIGWYFAGFAAILPLLGILLILLILFGQGATGAVKAFTMTADWTFSTQIPPPSVSEPTGHYLCTVAAGGHEKIVRPTRMGIRHGKPIVVNRQLCIANAFEELIADRTPWFHKTVRDFYDKHGYPLSQHITTRLRADIVYILMKPLEWLFLVVLYLADVDPERRIARQYLGKID